MSYAIRQAVGSDVANITALVNLAYRIEDFFKIGDRTDEADVREHFSSGAFLLIDAQDGGLAGCVYTEIRNELGYFGMLSSHPERRGAGLGRSLIAAAEAHCTAQGCTTMELEVVNLREELRPWYARLGYEECDVRPFVASEHTRVPCHFVVMRRPLVPTPIRQVQETFR